MKVLRPFLLAATIAAALLNTTFLYSKSPPSDISEDDKPATLKVLLVHGADKVFVEAKGRYHIYNLANNLLIDSGIFGKKGDLYPLEGGIKWGEHLQLIPNIRLVPGDSQSSILINGIEYKGCVNFRTFGDRLNIVNEIDVESYLSSTLTPKFQEKLPGEVAEAVAIIARTNAYYFLQSTSRNNWHVTAESVGYQGYALAFQKPYLDHAIQKTRHIIMTYQGAPFPAFWTENSAGKTTTFSAVFRKEALVPPSVTAHFAAHDREKNIWAFALSKDRLADIVEAEKVTGVDLFCDQETKKVYAIRVKDGGEVHDISFTGLQLALGEKKLQSNDFTITPKRDVLIIKGYGKGMGMGLCLYSAKKMAERGDRAPTMLKTFFPDVMIVKQETLASAN